MNNSTLKLGTFYRNVVLLLLRIEWLSYFSQDTPFMFMKVVRGLGVASKRQELITKNSKFDYVLLLQETYCTTQDVFNPWFVEFGEHGWIKLTPNFSYELPQFWSVIPPIF